MSDTYTPVTYKDLRDFLNTCTEEQLNNEVFIWREEGAIRIHHPEITQEDYLAVEHGEPSVLRSDIGDLDLEEDQEVVVTMPAGSIMFHEDF